MQRWFFSLKLKQTLKVYVCVGVVSVGRVAIGTMAPAATLLCLFH